MPTFTSKGVRLLKRERDSLLTAAHVVSSLVMLGKVDAAWEAVVSGLETIAASAVEETHAIHAPLPGQLPLPFGD